MPGRKTSWKDLKKKWDSLSKRDKTITIVSFIVIAGILSDFNEFEYTEKIDSESGFQVGQSYGLAGDLNGCNVCYYSWEVEFKSDSEVEFYTENDSGMRSCVSTLSYNYNKTEDYIQFTSIVESNAVSCLTGVLGRWDWRYNESPSTPIVQLRDEGKVAFDGFYKSGESNNEGNRLSIKY